MKQIKFTLWAFSVIAFKLVTLPVRLFLGILTHLSGSTNDSDSQSELDSAALYSVPDGYASANPDISSRHMEDAATIQWLYHDNND